ncbi:MAG: ACP S-malonyltransferase [Chlamydiales bacterium]|nr:ACP S-malonyltransferase [Chlamydiia bacterium]MCP5507323.1 ACP S-malonyltransferase [Chlamydiales bacterium]
MSKEKVAFIFPGQGSQYPGMGKSFVETFPTARHTFEEANDLLGRDIASIILNGPEKTLTETRNSQVGIFVMSVALLRVVKEQFPNLVPHFSAGLSLGEYTALHAAEYLDFAHCLPLVQHRGQFMNDACEKHVGTMAVILGLTAEEVEALVREVNMPNDLWAANFNCPGQVVISGTPKGVEAGKEIALQRGAKRVLPLQVHGAFHSGLMEEAEEYLKPYIEEAPITGGNAVLVMNVTGKEEKDLNAIRKNLIKQVTSPVRWEQGIRFMMDQGVDLFVEIGCGKTLAGFNKRINVPVPTISIENAEDLNKLEEIKVG